MLRSRQPSPTAPSGSIFAEVSNRLAQAGETRPGLRTPSGSPQTRREVRLFEQTLHAQKAGVQPDLSDPVVNLSIKILVFTQVVCGIRDRIGSVRAAAVDHEAQSLC
jgi:hypothetical protein